jgi:hypothetical protein
MGLRVIHNTGCVDNKVVSWQKICRHNTMENMRMNVRRMVLIGDKKKASEDENKDNKANKDDAMLSTSVTSSKKSRNLYA